MAPNISGNLSRIRNSSKTLNTLSDQASVQIRALDEHLKALNLGIDFEMKESFARGREQNSSAHQVDADYYLGFGRDDEGDFGIVVRASAPCTEEDRDGRITLVTEPFNSQVVFETLYVRSLSRVRRELRIKALPHLSAFIEKLAEHGEKLATSTKEDVEKTQSVIDELKSALGSGEQLPMPESLKMRGSQNIPPMNLTANKQPK